MNCIDFLSRKRPELMTQGKNLEKRKILAVFLQFCHEIYRIAQVTCDIVSWEDMCQVQSSDHLNL